MCDFSKFSRDSFFSDISEVNWDEIFTRGGEDIIDINRVFSSFYTKFNNFKISKLSKVEKYIYMNGDQGSDK